MAGRPLTLCDPIWHVWHVSPRSGEACCELLYPILYCTLLYSTSWANGPESSTTLDSQNPPGGSTSWTSDNYSVWSTVSKWDTSGKVCYLYDWLGFVVVSILTLCVFGVRRFLIQNLDRPSLVSRSFPATTHSVTNIHYAVQCVCSVYETPQLSRLTMTADDGTDAYTSLQHPAKPAHENSPPAGSGILFTLRIVFRFTTFTLHCIAAFVMLTVAFQYKIWISFIVGLSLSL